MNLSSNPAPNPTPTELSAQQSSSAVLGLYTSLPIGDTVSNYLFVFEVDGLTLQPRAGVSGPEVDYVHCDTEELGDFTRTSYAADTNSCDEPDVVIVEDGSGFDPSTIGSVDFLDTSETMPLIAAAEDVRPEGACVCKPSVSFYCYERTCCSRCKCAEDELDLTDPLEGIVLAP